MQHGIVDLREEDKEAVEVIIAHLYGVEYDPIVNIDGREDKIQVYNLATTCSLPLIKNQALVAIQKILRKTAVILGRIMGDIDEEETKIARGEGYKDKLDDDRGERDYYILKLYEAIEIAACVEPASDRDLQDTLLTFARMNKTLIFPESNSHLFESTFKRSQKLLSDNPDFAVKLKQTGPDLAEDRGFQAVTTKKSL